MGDLFIFIGLLAFLVGAISLIKPLKFFKITTRKMAAFVLLGGLVFALIGGSLVEGKTEDEVATVTQDKTGETPPPAVVDLQATLTAVPNKDKGTVTLAINTNAPDGAIFETLVVNTDLETVSGRLVAKDGKATADYAIPKAWGPCYCSASSILRFNSDKIIQPQNVKDAYGENGEKMTGPLVVETTNVKGNNGNLEVITFAYPDDATVTAHVDGLLQDVITELIKSSDGIITSIKPVDDWYVVRVTVSDAWYYSPKHDQERFVLALEETITHVAQQAGKIEGSSSIMVIVEDTYGKDLARSGMLGGVKIYD